MASESGRLKGDLRVALLTGATGWRDRNSDYSRPDLATTGILVALVAAVVMVLLVSAGLPGRGAAIDGSARWALAGVGTMTLVAAIAPSLAWPLGWRPRRPGPLLPFAIVRVTAAAVLVACWTALLGPISPVPAWVLGGVVGCEFTLTAWALGVRTSGPTWWWSFQRSSLHAGIWLLTVGASLAYPDRLWDLLRVPLSFQVMAGGAAVACHGLEAMRRTFDNRGDRAAQAVAATVHNRLAHWLHDDVTSSLGLLRFRQRSGDVTPAELGAELDQLDHRIRLLQLDELLASGAAELAHIIQPYIRLARDQGVEVVEVPPSDRTTTANGEMGYLVKRALGVLVPNAITAGASKLAFRVEALDGSHGDGGRAEGGAKRVGAEAGGPTGIVIEVEDDAGGFDLEALPAGRGLNGLRQDLGPGSITRVPVPGGSRVRVAIGVTDQRTREP